MLFFKTKKHEISSLKKCTVYMKAYWKQLAGGHQSKEAANGPGTTAPTAHYCDWQVIVRWKQRAERNTQRRLVHCRKNCALPQLRREVFMWCRRVEVVKHLVSFIDSSAPKSTAAVITSHLSIFQCHLVRLLAIKINLLLILCIQTTTV